MEFLRASSYSGTSSTGNVAITGGIRFDALTNQHVILVEDIVDTGTTLSQVMSILQERAQPKSIEVCTLLEKRLSKEQPPKIKAKYIGFSVPDQFVVGYGIDYEQWYRDCRDIWIISQEGIDYDRSGWT